jgi:hypothetical protein
MVRQTTDADMVCLATGKLNNAFLTGRSIGVWTTTGIPQTRTITRLG